MTEAFFLSVIAVLLAAAALSYTFYVNSQFSRLQRDQQRSHLLNQMAECATIIGNIMEDMNRYEGYSHSAFGDNPQNVPNLNDTLSKIESLRVSFSDYSQDTPIAKLQEASGQIEKVLSLMKSIAAKSPRLHKIRH